MAAVRATDAQATEVRTTRDPGRPNVEKFDHHQDQLNRQQFAPTT